jgi:sec-independent protein translocase protein TatC
MTTQQARANGTDPRLKAAKAAKDAKRPKDPEGRMPLTEHIRELRTRLFRSSVAILLGAVVGWLLHQRVLDALANPVCDIKGVNGIAKSAGTSCANGILTIEGPTSALALDLKVSLMVGLLIGSPVWLYQLWAFIAPGLHKKEKRYGIGFVALGVPLFAAGAALCYVIFPKIMGVLLGFTPSATANNIPFEKFIGFFLKMVVVFGVSFEVPLLVVLLNFVGILSADRLKHTWRYVTFAIFVFAAAAVPTGEPLGMLALAVPMCALYYMAIGVAILNDKRRAARSLNANLSPDEASELDLRPVPVDAPAPVERTSRDYDDLT